MSDLFKAAYLLSAFKAPKVCVLFIPVICLKSDCGLEGKKALLLASCEGKPDLSLSLAKLSLVILLLLWLKLPTPLPYFLNLADSGGSLLANLLYLN